MGEKDFYNLLNYAPFAVFKMCEHNFYLNISEDILVGVKNIRFCCSGYLSLGERRLFNKRSLERSSNQFKVIKL